MGKKGPNLKLEMDGIASMQPSGSCAEEDGNHIAFMTAKEQAMKVIESLPEDADFQRVLDGLAFVAGVQKGLQELDRGEVLSTGEARERIREWTSK